MAGPASPAGPQFGRVTSFDPQRGWGTVAGNDGMEHGFHATAVADGSRLIAVGTRVVFTLAPGHRGRYEARSIDPVPEGVG
ncbi:MAG TPA: hypothetical protein VND70_06475 [Acidimicrobiales bacterium]|nr:hypothetical protein [Acidimicrobiales bacterium]